MIKRRVITLFIIMNFSYLCSYTEPLHSFIFQEGIKLLESLKYYEEYQTTLNGVSVYSKIKNATENEDKVDWVYGYADNLEAPDVKITGIDVLTEYFIEKELPSITHFWDADNFKLNETYGHNIVKGEMYGNEYKIHNIPSAVTKASAILFGSYNELTLINKSWIAWGEEQAFIKVNGDRIYLYSPVRKFFFKNSDFKAKKCCIFKAKVK